MIHYLIKLKSDVKKAIDVIHDDYDHVDSAIEKCDKIKINVYQLLLKLLQLSIELCNTHERRTVYKYIECSITKYLNNIKELLEEILSVKMYKEVDYLNNCSWSMKIYKTSEVIREQLLIKE